MSELDGFQGYPATVEITVSGLLSDDWQDWFGGLVMSHEGHTTTLVGEVIDQPALYGLILKLRDLGLNLICVRIA
jgi:hypothetical protein